MSGTVAMSVAAACASCPSSRLVATKGQSAMRMRTAVMVFPPVISCSLCGAASERDHRLNEAPRVARPRDLRRDAVIDLRIRVGLVDAAALAAVVAGQVQGRHRAAGGALRAGAVAQAVDHELHRVA